MGAKRGAGGRCSTVGTQKNYTQNYHRERGPWTALATLDTSDKGKVGVNGLTIHGLQSGLMSRRIKSASTVQQPDQTRLVACSTLKDVPALILLLLPLSSFHIYAGPPGNGKEALL